MSCLLCFEKKRGNSGSWIFQQHQTAQSLTNSEGKCELRKFASFQYFSSKLQTRNEIAEEKMKQYSRKAWIFLWVFKWVSRSAVLWISKILTSSTPSWRTSRALNIKKSFDGGKSKRETSSLIIHERFIKRKREDNDSAWNLWEKKEQRKFSLMNIKVKIHWEICFSLCFEFYGLRRFSAPS